MCSLGSVRNESAVVSSILIMVTDVVVGIVNRYQDWVTRRRTTSWLGSRLNSCFRLLT